jgi:hypothetical protein
MSRRIIYIKNPSYGSHFRTLNGGGGSSKGPKLPGAPKSPSLPTPSPSNSGGPYTNSSNGAIYQSASSSWAIGTRRRRRPNPTSTLPSYGVGPYDTSFLDLPDIGQYPSREMETWEVVLGAGILAPIGGAVLPEVGFLSPAMSAIDWVRRVMIGTALIGGSTAEASLSLAGFRMTVNDSPRLRWDRGSGGYVTDYADIVQWIGKQKDYRQP